MLSVTAAIVLASLNVNALRGCEYGAMTVSEEGATQTYENVCENENAAGSGLI